MSKLMTARKAPKAPHPRMECCVDAECTSGLRNRYFVGKRMTPDAFSIEQDYSIGRRRLLNRAIHGWGVVYGYAVAITQAEKRRAEAATLDIGPGLALDEAGRELLQLDKAVLGLDAVIPLGEGAPNARRGHGDSEDRDAFWDSHGDTCWRLSVHYAEQVIGPMTLSDPCSCERHEWDRVCETVRYSLEPIDCDECCVEFGCELECECASGPCCEDHDREDDRKGYKPNPRQAAHEREARIARQREEPRDPIGEHPEDGERPHKTVSRGGCRCLCDHLTGLSVGTECETLCEIEEPCARVYVDLHNPVPLACVKLRRGECGWEFDSIYDDCGPRRLVKRNDLLFDLIRGCDLTTISSIGWAHLHRKRVAWEDFENAFGPTATGQDEEIVTEDFWVEFSRPVLAESIDRDCFSMTIVGVDEDTGWGELHRVPIVRIEMTPAPDDTSGRLVTRAKLVVEATWLRESIQSRRSVFDQDETLVEIEVRGHYIVDCNRQTIAANTDGMEPQSTAAAGPGGRFLSTFRVQRRTGQTAQAARS